MNVQEEISRLEMRLLEQGLTNGDPLRLLNVQTKATKLGLTDKQYLEKLELICGGL